MSDAVRLDDIGVETGAAVRRRGRASSTATGVYDSLIITQDGLAVAPDAVEHTHVDVPPLSTLVKLTYGLPQFAMLPLTLVISIYGTTLYESCGASLSYVSFFQSLARSFDVMTDPLMGWISDNTRLAFGRRRPFMASGALFYAALFCLLMYPPIDQEGNTTAYWFGANYILFYAFDTLANVPYGALGPELTPDSEERTKVFFFAKVYQGIGTLVGACAPEIFKYVLGAEADDGTVDLQKLRLAFLYTGLTFSSIYVVFMYLVVAIVRERPQAQDTKAMPLVPSILRSLKNKAFKPLLLGWVLDAIALSSLSAMFPFFIIYVIQPTTISAGVTQALCFGALFIAALIAMPIWMLIAKYIGKYRAWLLYNLVNSVTNFLYIFVGKGDPRSTIFITFLNGLPVGGQFLIDSILSDVIDYDEFLNGTRNEGSFTVFATFIPKFVSVPAGALPFSIMAMIGFVPSIDGMPQPQPTAVRNFIRFMFVVVPCLTTLAAFFVKRHYPIRTQDTIEKVTAGIAKHSEGKPAYDPITGRVVELLRIESEEEQDQVWTLDNFTEAELVLLRDDPHALLRSMTLKVAFAVLMLATFAGLTIGFFSKIDDAALSLIPILAVVFAGMSLCVLVVSLMRRKAAIHAVTSKLPVDLIERVIEHKGRGQRGGNGQSDLEQIQMYQKALADLEGEMAVLQLEVIRLRRKCGEPVDEQDEIVATKAAAGRQSVVTRGSLIERDVPLSRGSLPSAGPGGRTTSVGTPATAPAPEPAPENVVPEPPAEDEPAASGEDASGSDEILLT